MSKDYLDCRAYMKQRLKILIPIPAAEKLLAEKAAFDKLIEETETSIVTSKYRAYRYATRERICVLHGSPGGVQVAMRHLLNFIQPTGVIIQICDTGHHVMEGLIMVKFVVNAKVANRLVKKHDGLVRELCYGGSTSFSVYHCNNGITSERCIIVIGELEDILKASFLILHVIIECSIPHLKSMKLCAKSLEIWEKCKEPDIATESESSNLNVPLCYTSDGGSIPFSFLYDAGYDDDYVTALHFSYLMSTGVNPTSEQMLLNFSIQNRLDNLIAKCKHNAIDQLAER